MAGGVSWLEVDVLTGVAAKHELLEKLVPPEEQPLGDQPRPLRGGRLPGAVAIVGLGARSEVPVPRRLAPPEVAGQDPADVLVEHEPVFRRTNHRESAQAIECRPDPRSPRHGLQRLFVELAYDRAYLEEIPERAI